LHVIKYTRLLLAIHFEKTAKKTTVVSPSYIPGVKANYGAVNLPVPVKELPLPEKVTLQKVV